MTTAFDAVSPEELEHLVADVWRERGWSTSVSAVSGDGGVDVVAERDNPFRQKQLIQVKHYADDNPVSAPEVQQYAGLQHQHPDADSVVVVTSGRFSEPARETATEANVKLVDGEELSDLAIDAGILNSTADEPPSTTAGVQPRTIGDGGQAGDWSRMSPSEKLIEVFRVIVLLIVFGVMLYSIWQTGLFP
jgi:hypothetical protein